MRAHEEALADAFVPRQLRRGTPMVLLDLPGLLPHEADEDCERYECVPARWIEEHENETEDKR